MDQLLAIKVFGRVVEAGTFTKAAESLQMPNASVTKLIQALEGHLGVKLLQRTTRRVSVTADGAAYFEKTQRLLKELDSVDESFGTARKRPKGHLRIDVGSSVASMLLLPALPEFRKRYPEIQVDLGVSDRHVDMVGDNVDCVIRGGSLEDAALVARQIGSASWVTCATPDYLSEHGKPDHPRDLEGAHSVVNYLLTSSGRPVALRFQSGGEKCEVLKKHAVGVNESMAHLAAGVAGLGIIQTFQFAVASQLRSGQLVEILEPWKPPPYPFYVVYPPNRHMNHRLRVFIDWVVECFEKLSE